MISVPTGMTTETYTAAINSGASTHVRMTFASGTVLEDQDIEASGLVLRDVFNGETNLTFGRAVMKELTVSLLNSNRLEGIKWNEEFQLEMGVDVEEDDEIVTKWVTVGYFTGQRPEKIHYVDVIQFTAYDRMQWFDTSAAPVLSYIYDNYTWPMTVKNFYFAIVEYVGGDMGHGYSDYFGAVGNRTFEKGFLGTGEGMTCRDILALLAEACGCYAQVRESGRMMIAWYRNYLQPKIYADTEFSVEAADVGNGMTYGNAETYTNAQLEAYTWADLGGWKQVFGIDGLDVKQTEEDIGVHYGNTVGNLYTIVDNPFLAILNSTDADTYIKPIWDRLQSFGGRLPVRIECVGNWLIQSGDLIDMQVFPGSGSSTIIKVPVFSHELHWNGHPTSIYECTGEIQRPAMSATVREKLVNGSKYHKFIVDIDRLESEIGDVEGNVSSLSQDVSGIATRVTNTEGQVSSLEQRAGSIEANVANKLDKTSAYQDVGDIITEAQSLASSAETAAKNASIAKASGYQSVSDIIAEAQSLASSAETAAKNASIAKTSTYQDASSIVSAAVSQAGTAAGNTYIAKTTTYQTADSIVSAAVSQAGTAAGNTYIAKTSSYQDASSIVNAAKTYTDNELTDYSTTTQTATQISTYVTNNAYGKQSGITIDANGVFVTGSKKVEIKSGGSFEVDATNFKVDSVNKIVTAGKWTFSDDGMVFADTNTTVNADTEFSFGRLLTDVDTNKYCCGIYYNYNFASVGGVKQYTALIGLMAYNKTTDTTKILPIVFPHLGDSIVFGSSTPGTGDNASLDIYADRIFPAGDNETIGVYSQPWGKAYSDTFIRPENIDSGNSSSEFSFGRKPSEVDTNKFCAGIYNDYNIVTIGSTKNYNSSIVLMAYNKARNVTKKIPFWFAHGGSTVYLGDSNPSSNGYSYLSIYADIINPVGLNKTIGSSGDEWEEIYGNTIYYTNFNQNSSREVKHDILPMLSMGERLDSLEPVTYVYNKDETGKKRFGLIYEDTIKVMPEICIGDENSKADEKGINYMELVPMLLKEVQELRKRVSILEDRVNELEGNK